MIGGTVLSNLPFEVYIALGDSMSIDCYPAKDVDKAGLSKNEKVGATSLFRQNDDKLFPEFAGKDLAHLAKNIEFVDLTADGATTRELLDDERAVMLDLYRERKCLATLTVGGNDLLHVLRTRGNKADDLLLTEVEQLQDRLRKIVEGLEEKLPNSLLIMNSVYDPSDGKGEIPGVELLRGASDLQWLSYFNAYVKLLAGAEGRVLADVHSHFLGHGLSATLDSEFWYWKPSPIEPGYRGASEIRRLWLDAINRGIDER